MTRTTFFKSCVGVFQGGGCRAAAFVGAYEEAIQRGVSFTEVAGTSAGSIVAALIGAGASPKDLNNAIKRLDYKKFLSPPKGENSFLYKSARYFSAPLANLYFNQGFYSLEIKDWINSELNNLLKDDKHPITFRSLPFPTHIVSADLARSEAKIWSQRTTPHELVADAIEASCAVPIFFRPINGRHVDGGLISNLPAFVFLEGDTPRRTLSGRVLAFTLKADDAETWTLPDTVSYLKRLADTVVDGNQQLQLGLQNEVHAISIPTGAIKATDFDAMTPEVTQMLIENGKQATANFFDEELLRVKSNMPSQLPCYGADEIYARTVESLDAKQIDRVIITEHNSEWVYSLFPSLLCWRARNIEVDVILPAAGEKPGGHGLYRRKLLRALGVNLTELPNETSVPIRSYVICMQDKALSRAVIGIEKQSRAQTIEAVFYRGFMDEAIINVVTDRLNSLIKPTANLLSVGPTLERVDPGVLLSRLSSVSQYAKNGVTLSVEDVPLSRLVSLTRFVREYKYRQIDHLVRLYRDANIGLFEPAIVKLEENKSSLVTPPVVEEAGERYVLIEGSTRATFCRDLGMEKINCVVVKGVSDPLPGDVIPFDQVRVIGKTLDAYDRYEQFNYENFRSIERAAHPLDSLNDRAI